jgi:hypothetical protein
MVRFRPKIPTELGDEFLLENGLNRTDNRFKLNRFGSVKFSF